jgi:hypothetical protein
VEAGEIRNYLKASGHEVGLLLNFGTYRRFAHRNPQISQMTQIDRMKSV